MNTLSTLNIKSLLLLSISLCVACGDLEERKGDIETIELEQQQQELTSFATRPEADNTASGSGGIAVRPEIELSDEEITCVSKAYQIAYACSTRSRQLSCVRSARRHIERCTDGAYSLEYDDLRACHADGVDRQELCLDDGSKRKTCRNEGESIFSGCVESVLFLVD